MTRKTFLEPHRKKYPIKKFKSHNVVLNPKDRPTMLNVTNHNPKEIKAITNAAKSIKEDVMLAGEICVFKNGKSSNNREVAAALDEPNKHDIRFGVFDIISYKDEEPTLDEKEKTALIKKLAERDY